MTSRLGEHTLSYWSVDVAGNVELAKQINFQVASVNIQHDGPGVTFDRWVTGQSTAYSGGGYVYSRWSGTELQARFTGSGIRWIGPRQSGYGKADVYIDGVLVGSTDQYAATGDSSIGAMIYESPMLTDGPHTLKIKLTGQKNPASSGYVVVVDRFEVLGANPGSQYTRVDERAPGATFTGGWVHATNRTYYKSGYAYSRWADSRYSRTFTGRGIAWIGPMTGEYGRVDITIDGPSGRVYSGTISQYGTVGWRKIVWESPQLPLATYTLKLRVRGDKVAASTGVINVLDAWDVRK
jgi:hypothetical protein